jgi:hypothetical protein
LRFWAVALTKSGRYNPRTVPKRLIVDQIGLAAQGAILVTCQAPTTAPKNSSEEFSKKLLKLFSRHF